MGGDFDDDDLMKELNSGSLVKKNIFLKKINLNLEWRAFQRCWQRQRRG